jgi:hypothetical protein
MFDGLRRLALVSPQTKRELDQIVSGRDSTVEKDESQVDEDYAILLTTALPGTIPARIWRASHVIYV